MSAAFDEKVPLESPCLVEASAGTGKTHAITTCFIRGVVEQGLMPDQILVVTYTKAATAELRGRTRTRLLEATAMLDGVSSGDDALDEVVQTAVARLGRADVEQMLVDALGRMDQAAIFTIHAFCQRLLQDFPLSFGVDLEVEVSEDARSVNRELAIDFWAAELYDAPDWLVSALGRAKVDVTHLTRLASDATRPGVEVIGPERVEVDETSVEAWRERKARAAHLWAAERANILEALGAPDLYKNIYGSRVAAWPPELDAFFADDTWRSAPKFFLRLCSDKMREKTRSGFDAPQHPFFDECERLRRADEALEAGFDSAVFAFQQRFIDRVQREARRRRETDAVLTFDDLLASVYAPLDSSSPKHDPAIREEIVSKVSKAYPLALVDEFQDTDSIQYGIFSSIYGDGSAVYVGDPKQAIYAFRGADIYSYIRAVRDVSDRRYVLDTNRRSDPALVAAVNSLFSIRTPPFVLDELRMEPVRAHEARRSSFDPALQVLYLDADRVGSTFERSVSSIVANEVALLLQSNERIEDRPVAPDDIAVLCRSNAQAAAVTDALRALQVPTSLEGDASVLATTMARDLGAVLDASLLPGDSRLVRRALLTELLGVTPRALSAMGDAQWSGWVSRFSTWRETWHQYGVVRFFEDMLRDTDAESRIARHPAARRKLTDLRHLEELLLRGERERRRDPFALMQWFRRLEGSSPGTGAVEIESLQQRPDAESGAVRVSTIHKSKGLEYGVVYVPFPWKDAALFRFDRRVVKFHDAEGNLRIDLGSPSFDAHLEASKRENLSEVIRLLYVAVTRAKHRCTVFWGPAERSSDSALGYLLHGEGARPDEGEMLHDVEAFAAASGGTAGVAAPSEERAAAFEAPREGRTLAARPLTRTHDHARRIGSFTSLTGHDEKSPRPRSGADTPEPAGGLFEALPAGAKTGLMLHAVLERVELDRLERRDALQTIREELRRSGFDEAHAEAVLRDLEVVAQTPLTTEERAPRLVDLPRKRQLRELEFTLGLGSPGLAGLCDLLQEHGSPSPIPDYHQQLRALRTDALQPFLRGYIDLMFDQR